MLDRPGATMARMEDLEATSEPVPVPPVALVTGGSRGIGLAIVEALAADGWAVALTSRDIARVEPIATRIRGRGGEAAALELDVADAGSVEAAVASAETALGPLGVLVNNAGIQRLGGLLTQTADDWDAVHATNLKGAFLCAQAVARRMVERRAGVIINISSAAGIIPFEGRIAYAAAKGGLNMLTRSLASELAPHGIRVNAVAPTFVETDLGRKTLDRPGVRASLQERIPLGRVATTADVAGMVRYLVSDEAAFVTGTVVPVDGGVTMS